MLLRKWGVVSPNVNDRLFLVREMLCFRVRSEGFVKYCQSNSLFMLFNLYFVGKCVFNPLKPELNPICYLLALLGAHHFLHVSR